MEELPVRRETVPGRESTTQGGQESCRQTAVSKRVDKKGSQGQVVYGLGKLAPKVRKLQF